MPFEKSCGAIVFRRNKTIKYLLLHYEAGHWDFPKGKQEKGEKEMETVAREVFEETGIPKERIEFLPDFNEKIHYFFRQKNETVFKEVSFYLVKAKQSKVKISFEHVGFKWLPFKQALKQLTYKNARTVLEKAHHFLTKKKKS